MSILPMKHMALTPTEFITFSPLRGTTRMNFLQPITLQLNLEFLSRPERQASTARQAPRAVLQKCWGDHEAVNEFEALEQRDGCVTKLGGGLQQGAIVDVGQDFLDDGQLQRLVGQNLQVFVLLREAGLGAAVEEEQPPQRLGHEEGLPHVLQADPAALLLELLRDDKQVIPEEVELVVEQSVPRGQLGYHYALLEWRQEGVPRRRQSHFVLVLQPRYVVNKHLQLLVDNHLRLFDQKLAQDGLSGLEGSLDQLTQMTDLGLVRMSSPELAVQQCCSQRAQSCHGRPQLPLPLPFSPYIHSDLLLQPLLKAYTKYHNYSVLGASVSKNIFLSVQQTVHAPTTNINICRSSSPIFVYRFLYSILHRHFDQISTYSPLGAFSSQIISPFSLCRQKNTHLIWMTMGTKNTYRKPMTAPLISMMVEILTLSRYRPKLNAYIPKYMRNSGRVMCSLSSILNICRKRCRMIRQNSGLALRRWNKQMASMMRTCQLPVSKYSLMVWGSVSRGVRFTIPKHAQVMQVQIRVPAMQTIRITRPNLSKVVVLNSTCTTKSWMEYPIISDAPRSINRGPVAGIVLGSWGADACAQVMNIKYPTTLRIPMASNRSPKLQYLITTVNSNSTSMTPTPIHLLGGMKPSSCLTMRRKQLIRIPTRLRPMTRLYTTTADCLLLKCYKITSLMFLQSPK